MEVSIIQGSLSRGRREKFANTIGYKSNANSHNVHHQNKKIYSARKKLHIKCIKKCLHNTHSQLLCFEYAKKNLGCCFFHLISRLHINSISLPTQCMSENCMYIRQRNQQKLHKNPISIFPVNIIRGSIFSGEEGARINGE